MSIEGYAPYTAVAAEGQRIGLMTCLRCGAVVMLEKGYDWPEVHDKWHEEQEQPVGTQQQEETR